MLSAHITLCFFSQPWAFRADSFWQCWASCDINRCHVPTNIVRIYTFFAWLCIRYRIYLSHKVEIEAQPTQKQGEQYKTIFIYNTFGSTILLKFDPTQQCKKFEDSVAHRQLTILIEIFDELLRKNWLLGYTFYKEELKYMNNVYKQLTEMGYKQNTTLNYMTK